MILIIIILHGNKSDFSVKNIISFYILPNFSSSDVNHKIFATFLLTRFVCEKIIPGDC